MAKSKPESLRAENSQGLESETPPAYGEDESRRQRIAQAAYYKAERRNFQGERQLDDWLEAEREIDSLAAAAGIQAEASKIAEGPDDVAAPAIRGNAAQADGADHIAPEEIRLWADVLAVPPARLRTAIERVGTRVEDVKRFLKSQPQA